MKRKEQKPAGYVEKKRIWINNKIKQMGETNNKKDRLTSYFEGAMSRKNIHV